MTCALEKQKSLYSKHFPSRCGFFLIIGLSSSILLGQRAHTAQPPSSCNRPIATHRSHFYNLDDMPIFFGLRMPKQKVFSISQDGKNAAGITCIEEDCVLSLYSLDPPPKKELTSYLFENRLKDGMLLNPVFTNHGSKLVLQITHKPDSEEYNAGDYLIIEDLPTKPTSNPGNPKKITVSQWSEITDKYTPDERPEGEREKLKALAHKVKSQGESFEKPIGTSSDGHWFIFENPEDHSLTLYDLKSHQKVAVPEWTRGLDVGEVKTLSDGSLLISSLSYQSTPPLRIWPQITCADKKVRVVPKPECATSVNEKSLKSGHAVAEALSEVALGASLCSQQDPPSSAGDWGKFTGPVKSAMTNLEIKRFLTQFQKPGMFQPQDHLPIIMGALSPEFLKQADAPTRLAFKEALLTVISERPALYTELKRLEPESLNDALQVKSETSPCLSAKQKMIRSNALQRLITDQLPTNPKELDKSPCPDFSMITKFGITEEQNPELLKTALDQQLNSFVECPGFNNIPAYLTRFRAIKDSEVAFDPKKHSLCFDNSNVGEDLKYLAAKIGSEYGVCAGMSAIHVAFFKHAKFNPKKSPDTSGAVFRKSHELMDKYFRGCVGTIEFNGYENLNALCEAMKKDKENRKIFQDLAVLANSTQNFSAMPDNVSNEMREFIFPFALKSAVVKKDFIHKFFDKPVDIKKFTPEEMKKSSEALKRALVSIHRRLKRGEPAHLTWLVPLHSVAAVSIEERTDPGDPGKATSYRVGYIDPNEPKSLKHFDIEVYTPVTKNGKYTHYSSDHGVMWDTSRQGADQNACKSPSTKE